ncbi:MAG TPA: DUF3592 domain-containing protein [Terriglobia bacterium]|nr:DUF3592 domain-containing protein [Terriglobia bacterium]
MSRGRDGSRYPAKPRRHRLMIWGGMILCGALSVCGVLLMVGGFRDWRMSTASVNWPSTEAEIVGSEVVKRMSPPTRYSPYKETITYKVAFRYAVNGKDYISQAMLPARALQRASDGEPQGTGFSARPESAASVKSLTIRYDPADPATAIADPNGLAGGPIGIGVGLLLIVIGLPFIIVLGSWLPRRG